MKQVVKKPLDPNEGLSATHPAYRPSKINRYIKDRVPTPQRHEFEAAKETGAETNQEVVDAILEARRKGGTPTAPTPPVAPSPSDPPPWLRDGFVMLPIRAYQELLAAAGR